jgi:hypothetical protein
LGGGNEQPPSAVKSTTDPICRARPIIPPWILPPPVAANNPGQPRPQLPQNVAEGMGVMLFDKTIFDDKSIVAGIGPAAGLGARIPVR